VGGADFGNSSCSGGVAAMPEPSNGAIATLAATIVGPVERRTAAIR